MSDEGPTPLIKEVLTKLTGGGNLDEERAHTLMLAIMEGEASTPQIAGIVTAMAARGESVEEITGFARAMREKSTRIRPNVPGRLVDTCGTGGAPVKTFNVSTTSAFIAAGAGAYIAKHGNRSSTSPSGSADVLEALGARLDQSGEEVAKSIESTGIGFLFSPNFHPAMKHAMPARRALGVRTVFNLLGPLTNPAGADAQVLGVPRDDLVRPLAEVLAKLGVTQAIVLHGEGGLDEASTIGPTHLAHVHEGQVREETLHAEELGIPTTTKEQIATRSPQDSAQALLAILDGDDSPLADFAVLNASLAIHVAGLATDLQQGVEKARDSITSGKAREHLQAYIRSTGGQPLARIETERP
jgi:anthranilate phosphoribosyltransferase